MQDGQPVSCSSVCLKVPGLLILRLSLLLLLVTITNTNVGYIIVTIVLDTIAVLAPRNFRNSLFTLICKNSAIGRYTSAANRVCEVV